MLPNNTNGSKENQQRPIKKSYRNRGNNPRIITTRKKKKILGKTGHKKNIFAVKNLIPRIKPYSPKKIKTKGPPLYSILKPLINSLSPSAKSNGARLASATTQITHKNKKKRLGVKNLSGAPPQEKKKRCKKIVIEKIISYLTPWATPRRPPSTPNLDCEETPIISKMMEDTPEILIKKNIPQILPKFE
jgi:hypothetical protein